jgi:hypothetical protein
MTYRVEGLPYPNEAQADVVAQRFARRYGRDIAVCNADDVVLYYMTSNGKRVRECRKSKSATGRNSRSP